MDDADCNSIEYLEKASAAAHLSAAVASRGLSVHPVKSHNHFFASRSFHPPLRLEKSERCSRIDVGPAVEDT